MTTFEMFPQEAKKLVLRPYQERAITDLKRGIASGHKRQVLQAATGAGKCLGKGTPVLMFDGRIKSVEEIAVGDLLMGPDSGPRRVLSICRGREMLYRITPTKGDSYVVNESHVLSLQRTCRKNGDSKAGEIVNLPVHEYLRRSPYWKHIHKGWRIGVEFQLMETHPDIPPYILGLWLGDGSQGSPAITTADAEVAAAWRAHAAAVGHDIRVESGRNCETIYITTGKSIGGHGRNRVRRALYDLGVAFEKHIPHRYKANTEAVRLDVLAGLIDTDGHLSRNGYDLVFKQKKLAEDTVFIARSLGLAAYMKKCRKGIKNLSFEGVYYRISITGDTDKIPCRVARRKASKRQQKKDVLRTGINVESIGEGDYYGFEIDGDRLFLLGDFTVTHNTAIASAIMQGAAVKGKRACFIVDSLELVEQAFHRFVSDGLWCGVMQSDHEKTNWSAPIQVATVQTLRTRWPRIPDELRFDLLVIDECHVLHKAHQQIMSESGVPVIGLSATPFRKGLGKVFSRLTVAATTADLIQEGHLSPYRVFAPHIPDLKGVKTDSNGDWQEDALAEVMGGAEIVGEVVPTWMRLAEGRPTLIFCCNVAKSRQMAKEFQNAGVKAEHVDGYMPQHERAIIIEKYRRGEITVLSNCCVLTKGFDAPETSCIVLMRPTKSLMMHIQIIGRGLRTAPGKDDLIILDHAGNCIRNGLPDEPLPEDLDDGEKKENPDRKQREKKEKLPEPCPKCQFLKTVHVCPCCGFKAERHEVTESANGELVELKGGNQIKMNVNEKALLYAQLLGYAQMMGHKRGWAWFKCREICGSAPARSKQIEPEVPTEKTMQIIRYLNKKRRSV